ncbi:amino acid adenylation domain-containing protein [Streptomyces sp. NPDC046985]|uniref:amino acid adenylation domain-containing protein n=1 Tax=Streptomyces sp. NPDC046985 TaxID=3155377 RepID=UPI0033D15FAD
MTIDNDRIADLRRRMLEELLEGRVRLPGSRPPSDGAAELDDGELDDRESGPAPASFAQQRMWFLEGLAGERASYNVPLPWTVEGPLDVPALRSAMRDLLARHDGLRTALVLRDGELVQDVAADAEAEFDTRDLSGLPEEDRDREASGLVREWSLRPFDLATAPLVRVGLATLAADRHLLVLTLHHAVTDARSESVLMDDLARFYEARSAEESPAASASAPARGTRYADFARQELREVGGSRWEDGRDFWRRELDGASPPPLPYRAGRGPADFEASTAPSDIALVTLAGDERRRLLDWARQQRVTPFTVLNTALALLLRRYGAGDDVTIGVPVAGRTRDGFEDTVGLFVNTVGLRVRVEAGDTFASLAQRTRDTLNRTLEHQDFPYDVVVRDAGPGGTASGGAGDPLVGVMCNVTEAPGTLRLGSAPLRPARPLRGAAKFPLELNAELGDDEIHCEFEYCPDLFDRDAVERLARSYQALVHRLTSAPPGTSIAAADPHTAGELDQLRSFATGRQPDGEDADLWALLRQGFDAAPDRPALVTDQATHSYAELAAEIAHWSAVLRGTGVHGEQLVAVAVPRGLTQAALTLACAAVGVPFLGVDTAQPPAAVRRTLAAAGARLVVGERELTDQAPDGAARLVLDSPGGAERPNVIGPAVFPDALGSRTKAANGADDTPPADAVAYGVTTSGSSGQPKAVLVTRRGLCATLRWLQAAHPLDPDDRVLQATSAAFDPWIWQLLWPLTAGAAVVLADPAEQNDARAQIRTAARHRVTVLHAVPSVLATWLIGDELAKADTLRIVACGGERLPAELVRQARRQTGARILNFYGLAETSIESVSQTVPATDDDLRTVPIGRPNRGTDVFVVDPDGGLSPIGAVGEILIGGEGLARGYAGLPGRTAVSFVPDHLTGRPGGRLYRTGDLARWLPDGRLEHLGRLDEQVKVNGMRVEPGEIEAAMRRLDGVLDAAVTVNAGGLTAWAVAGPAVTADAIACHLAAELPAGKRPGRTVLLERLPRTAGGKVDRRALDRLPAPAPQDAEEPRTPTEHLLAALWSDLLDGPVGRDTHFFRAGGHSLAATRMLALAERDHGLRIGLRAVFDHPVLSDLAAVVEAGGTGGTSGTGPAREPAVADLPSGQDGSDPAILPLSLPQQRLWFLQQLDPRDTSYNVFRLLRLRGGLDLAALEAALRQVVGRHAILRATFPTREDGSAEYRIHPVPDQVLDVVDLPWEAALEAARDRARQPLDLAGGPLVRFTAYRVAPDETVLALHTHHIVVDDRSFTVLFRELAAAYSAYASGEAPDLPELPVQYHDHARRQTALLASGRYDDQLAHWKRVLDDAPQLLELPQDHPRPLTATAPRVSTVRAEVDGTLREAVNRVALDAGSTPSVVMLGLFVVLLRRLSGARDVVVGMTTANRASADVQDLIGFFVNSLPLRHTAPYEVTLAELLRDLRDGVLDALDNQDVPFEKVVEAVDPVRSPHHNPVFQVMFDMQPELTAAPRFEGVTVEELPVAPSAAKLDLLLSVADRGDRLDVELQYNGALFDHGTAERWLGHYLRLLASATTPGATGLRVSRLDMLSRAEREDLLVRGRGRPATDRRAVLPDLLREQRRRTPDSPALVLGDTVLSYRELDESTDDVAARLAALGIGPGATVGVCFPRCVRQLQTIVGVLKTGAAYVPLDVTETGARLAHMIEDAAIGLVVCDPSLREGLERTAAEHRPALRVLDRLPEAPATTRPVPRIPDSLAYVLYTSGSTGTPKGVAMPHRTVVNLVESMREELPLDAGTAVLQFNQTTFDVSCQEMFSTWDAGGTLVMLPSDDARRDPVVLLDVMSRHDVRRLFVSFGGLTNLVQYARESGDLPPLRLSEIITTGEQQLVTPALTDFLRRVRTERLVNHYGPTETHVVTTTVLSGDPEHWAPATPVGRAIPGSSLWVLDPDGALVPDGVTGELYVGGTGIADGYIGRPASSAERFVPDHLGGGPGRLHRTGDHVRWNREGQIEYVRRIDSQVKVRGQRVDLREIESVLRGLPGVDAARVLLVRTDRSADGGPADLRSVVAFAVDAPDAPGGAGRETDLLDRLRELLPAHMVPARLHLLDRFPLTRNSKIDARALEELAASRATVREPRPPRTDTERFVAAVWEEVLQQERVGLDDDLFALGGHSLLATRIISRIRRRYGEDVPLRLVFDHPTVGALARQLDERRDRPAADGAGPDDGPEPVVRRRERRTT